MPKATTVFTTRGHVWDITLLPDYNQGDREVKVVTRYATANLLASGWLTSGNQVAGRPILVDGGMLGNVYV